MPDNFTDSSFELAGSEQDRAAEASHARSETVKLAKRLRGMTRHRTDSVTTRGSPNLCCVAVLFATCEFMFSNFLSGGEPTVSIGFVFGDFLDSCFAAQARRWHCLQESGAGRRHFSGAAHWTRC
eukprot:2360350-Amphidinium_carterae.4